MKKLLSVLLVLVMILSLGTMVACAKQEKTPAAESTTPAAETADPATPADPAAEPATPAAEPAEEGGFVGVVSPQLTNEWLVNMLTSFCNRMEEVGYTTQMLAANGDPAQYIPIMENYLTMGAKLILNVAMDTDSCKDITLRCIENDCYVIMLGVYPDYEISGGVASDFYSTGVAAALMLIDWFDVTYPEAETVPCAVQYSENTSDATKRSNGFKDTLSADDRIFISYFKTFNENSVDNGYTFAEEAMTYDNNIRGFLLYDNDPAIGVQNYLAQMPGVDLTQFCIISVGQTEAALALMEQAKTDPASSAIRGVLSYGGADPGETLYNIAAALLDGSHEAPYWIFDPMYTMNNWGWEVPEGMN